MSQEITNQIMSLGDLNPFLKRFLQAVAKNAQLEMLPDCRNCASEEPGHFISFMVQIALVS